MECDKIDVGCGENSEFDFIKFDIRKLNNIHVVGDARCLPFKNNSIKFIRCSHMIEHFEQRDIKKVFDEFNRILDNNGKLQIVCPNYRMFFEYYRQDKWNMKQLNDHIFGGRKNEMDYHKTGLDINFLSLLLYESAFKIINKIESEPAELNLICAKWLN